MTTEQHHEIDFVVYDHEARLVILGLLAISGG